MFAKTIEELIMRRFARIRWTVRTIIMIGSASTYLVNAGAAKAGKHSAGIKNMIYAKCFLHLWYISPLAIWAAADNIIKSDQNQ